MGNFSKLNKPKSSKNEESFNDKAKKPAGQLQDNRPENAMQLKLSALANTRQGTNAIQLAKQEEKEEIQLKGIEEKELQLKEIDKGNEKIKHGSNDTNSPISIPIQRVKNETGLPDQLKSGVENLSGLSLDDVKVHYNSAKPAQLQAHAFAQGTDIHVAPGQEKHLPHEAWHVVQQKQGRVKPTRQLKGKVNVNDDSGLEKEADQMGLRALSGKETESDHALQAKFVSSNAIVQKVDEDARPVYDEKMTELVEQTKAILMELGKKGKDWKNQYRIQGKEKAQEKTKDLLSGKKEDTNYGKEALKRIWGELTTEEKFEVAKAVGGPLWEAVKSAGSSISELPDLNFGGSNESSKGKEKEKEPVREKPKKEKEKSEGSDESSLVGRALSELTLEDAKNAYKVYKEYSRLKEKFDEAMDTIVKTSGDVGEEVGSFFGSLRDKKEFSDLCEDQKRGFFMARKRLEALRPQVAGDARYNDEINALNDALSNVIHGPGKVYLGLNDNWSIDYQETCQIAFDNLQLAQSSRDGAMGLLKRGYRFLTSEKKPVNKQEVPNLDKPNSLGEAQAKMVSKIKEVTDKGWGSFTYFFFTPKGVSEVKSEVSKDGDPKKILAKVKGLATSYGNLDSSKNRSAETQILYDALAKVNVNDLNSVWAATSKIDDVINMI